jgi:hypothetical protein
MRVSPNTTQNLRDGKQALRAARRAMSLPEKVQQVVELQKIAVRIAKSQGKLKPRERVWNLHRQA